MTKAVRNIIIIIAIVVILFAIIFAMYQYFQEEPMNANTLGAANVLEDANTGLENMLNEIFNEETGNGNIENVTNTEQAGNANNSSNQEGQNSNPKEETDLTEDDNRATPRETKAIELAKEQWKKEWGSTNGVSFNVSIQSDGKYGVTIYDTSSTKSIQFYIVDVDTGIVTER